MKSSIATLQAAGYVRSTFQGFALRYIILDPSGLT
jgi:hypothetical protein